MRNYKLVCCKCGHIEEKEPAYKCRKRGKILSFEYDFLPCDYQNRPGEPGIFQFADVLPVEQPYENCSLEEGNTALVKAVRLSKKFRLEHLSFKLESLNPSASFKDRALAVAVNCMKRLRIPKAVIASSGNASAAAATYAARADLDMIAIVPETTPDNKVQQAVCHGAKVVKVPGPFSASLALAKQTAAETGWLDLTTTFNCPYAREGYKTIGYELYEQMKHKVPDWIVLPTGDGPILAAVYQAYSELKMMGLVEQIPKLVCVQAEHCGPIAKAFLDGTPVQACKDAKTTLASGINDSLEGYTDDGDFTVACIRNSGGTAVLLTEEDIAQSVRLLALEGIYAEPAAAVSAVAIEKLCAQGVIQPKDCVVGVVTGHGLKNPLVQESAAKVVTNVSELIAAVEN